MKREWLFNRYNGNAEFLFDEICNVIRSQNFYQFLNSRIIFSAFLHRNDVLVSLSGFRIFCLSSQQFIRNLSSQSIVSIYNGKVNIRQLAGSLVSSNFNNFRL